MANQQVISFATYINTAKNKYDHWCLPRALKKRKRRMILTKYLYGADWLWMAPLIIHWRGKQEKIEHFWDRERPQKKPLYSNCKIKQHKTNMEIIIFNKSFVSYLNFYDYKSAGRTVLWLTIPCKLFAFLNSLNLFFWFWKPINM